MIRLIVFSSLGTGVETFTKVYNYDYSKSSTWTEPANSGSKTNQSIGRDPSNSGSGGKTLLHHAVWVGDFEIFKFLVEDCKCDFRALGTFWLIARRAYCVETSQNRCVFVRASVRTHHFRSLSEQSKWSHLMDLIQKGDQKWSRDVKSVSHLTWDRKESDYRSEWRRSRHGS